MRSWLILLTPRRKKVGRWKEVLCVKWEMKPNDMAGQIVCGHRTPAPRQQSRPKNLRLEGRRPDYMPVRRGLWPAGW